MVFYIFICHVCLKHCIFTVVSSRKLEHLHAINNNYLSTHEYGFAGFIVNIVYSDFVGVGIRHICKANLYVYWLIEFVYASDFFAASHYIKRKLNYFGLSCKRVRTLNAVICAIA